MEKKRATEFFAAKYVFPLVKLLRLEGVSDHFNYLPYCDEDEENLAWVYYYEELEKVRRSLDKFDGFDKETKKKFVRLWKEVREYVRSCCGIDYLPDRWYAANPKLRVYTSRAGIYHMLKKEMDSERLNRLGEFTETDELIDRLGWDIIEEDGDCSSEMVMAFLALALSEVGDCVDKTGVVAALQKEALSRPFRLTKKKMETLRRHADAYRKDTAAFEKEAAKRKKMLEALDIDVSEKPLSDYAKAMKEKLEKEEDVRVYHIMEDEKGVRFLCISPERFYWNIQRPKKTQLGIFAFAYRKTFAEGGYTGFGQVPMVEGWSDFF